MERKRFMVFAVVLASLSSVVQGQDPKGDLQKKVNSLFVLTKMTADNSDIVKPGSVLVLHKDGLIMYGVETKVAPTNTYKDGKLSMGFGANMSMDMQLGAVQQGLNHLNVPQRKFVDGEKFWATAISVKDDGVILLFCSDPFDNVRYFGQVKFPFAKKSLPSGDEIARAVTEVVTAEQAEEAAQPEAHPPAAAAPVPAQQQPPPIAPPPPPVDAPPAQPKIIALGQTKDMVTTILGQPTKAAILGEKEIYYYPDMKVIFIKGKVSDIQ